VVLQLVAEGKVGLDTSVNGYLPELGLDPRITVRMLLQHTSGLANYTGQYYPNGSFVPGIPVIGQAWVDNRFHTYRSDELVRLALAMPAPFEPGTGPGLLQHQLHTGLAADREGRRATRTKRR
jgi:D-alanyl-D-alanine carboxypeptidase